MVCAYDVSTPSMSPQDKQTKQEERKQSLAACTWSVSWLSEEEAVQICVIIVYWFCQLAAKTESAVHSAIYMAMDLSLLLSRSAIMVIKMSNFQEIHCS